ncbi:uncharacterized protein LOC144168803 isoform X3 [Haemaphysalis longicornis]
MSSTERLVKVDPPPAGSLAFLFHCFLWLCGDKCDFACCVFGVLETCTPNWFAAMQRRAKKG